MSALQPAQPIDAKQFFNLSAGPRIFAWSFVELTRTLFRQARERTRPASAPIKSVLYGKCHARSTKAFAIRRVRSPKRGKTAPRTETSIGRVCPLALITPDRGYRLAGTGFLTYGRAFLSESTMQESQADTSIIRFHHRRSPEYPGKHKH